MSRPTFEEIYMQLAHGLARRSTCRRLQVGCVISTPDWRKIVAVGYNGGAAGLENDCESDEPGQCGHIHAEENAIINCDSPRQLEKVVISTNTPCPMCCKRIINLGGVVRVVYDFEYRVETGLALLRRAGIECVQMQSLLGRKTPVPE